MSFDIDKDKEFKEILLDLSYDDKFTDEDSLHMLSAEREIAHGVWGERRSARCYNPPMTFDVKETLTEFEEGEPAINRF